MTSCVPPQLTATNLLVAADRDAVGVAGGLALGVERERGEGLRAVESGPASAAGRAPSPGRCCSVVVANPRFFMLAT